MLEDLEVRTYLMGKALSNSTICTGEANLSELDEWFGKNLTGITKQQIVAKQAALYADAVLREQQAWLDLQGDAY